MTWPEGVIVGPKNKICVMRTSSDPKSNQHPPKSTVKNLNFEFFNFWPKNHLFFLLFWPTKSKQILQTEENYLQRKAYIPPRFFDTSFVKIRQPEVTKNTAFQKGPFWGKTTVIFR